MLYGMGTLSTYYTGNGSINTAQSSKYFAFEILVRSSSVIQPLGRKRKVLGSIPTIVVDF